MNTIIQGIINNNIPYKDRTVIDRLKKVQPVDKTDKNKDDGEKPPEPSSGNKKTIAIV